MCQPPWEPAPVSESLRAGDRGRFRGRFMGRAGPSPGSTSTPLSHPLDAIANQSHTEEIPNCPLGAQRVHLPGEVGT